MADFQYVWAIVTGVLGILATIPLTVRYINGQLPTKQLQPMFELLGDANSLLLSCVEEGLVYGRKAQNYETRLSQLRFKAEDVRLRATSAKTYYEDVANWWKGLTQSIGEICMNVRDVRADISSNSLRERERLEAQRRATRARAADREQVGAGDELPETTSCGDADAALPDPATTFQRDVAESADTCAPTASTSDAQDVSSSITLFPNSSSESLVTPSPPSSITKASTTTSSAKMSHHNRRCSVFSASSSNSSTKSVRLKRGGDPPSRARAMARFMRRARAARPPPVFIVEPHRLAAFEFATHDDDDGDWVDVEAIRIVT